MLQLYCTVASITAIYCATCNLHVYMGHDITRPTYAYHGTTCTMVKTKRYLNNKSKIKSHAIPVHSSQLWKLHDFFQQQWKIGSTPSTGRIPPRFCIKSRCSSSRSRSVETWIMSNRHITKCIVWT